VLPTRRRKPSLLEAGGSALKDADFQSWCFRNGGETYEENDGPGLACQFPDTDAPDRIHYHPDTGTFDIVTGGLFYTSRDIHQHADSWIDDEDRLHIDSADARVIVDPE